MDVGQNFDMTRRECLIFVWNGLFSVFLLERTELAARVDHEELELILALACFTEKLVYQSLRLSA